MVFTAKQVLVDIGWDANSEYLWQLLVQNELNLTVDLAMLDVELQDELLGNGGDKVPNVCAMRDLLRKAVSHARALTSKWGQRVAHSVMESVATQSVQGSGTVFSAALLKHGASEASCSALRGAVPVAWGGISGSVCSGMALSAGSSSGGPVRSPALPGGTAGPVCSGLPLALGRFEGTGCPSSGASPGKLGPVRSFASAVAGGSEGTGCPSSIVPGRVAGPVCSASLPHKTLRTSGTVGSLGPV